MTNRIAFAQLCSAVRRKVAVPVSVALCMLWLSLTANAQNQHIISFDVPGAQAYGTIPVAINNEGTIAGYYYDENYVAHGFVRRLDGAFNTFDAPGAGTVANNGNGTFPTGINDSGVVSGYSNDATDMSLSFLRSPDGKFTTFQAPGADTKPADAAGTNAISINALGAVSGYYGDSSGVVHGFLRSPDGRFRTFEVLGAGGYGSFPIALNLEGGIVGYYTDSNYLFHAFLRSPDGKFTTWVGADACDTNGAQGCYGSAAFNINAFGTIAGGYMDNSGNFVGHGLIRHPNGTFTKVDVPGAGTGLYQGTGCPGCFLGLNQWGAIAGIYTDANNVYHGFLRSPDGQFTTFDAPGAGTGSYQGTGCPSDCVVSLNDWGAITGLYTDANYVYHGFLRTP